MRRFLFGSVNLLAVAAISTAAGAVTIATPAIYAGNVAVTGVCSLTNVGSAPVSIASIKIRNKGGLLFALIANSCGPSLAAGRTCSAAVNIGVTGQPASCAIDVLPNAATVRGTFELRSATATTLRSDDLR